MSEFRNVSQVYVYRTSKNLLELLSKLHLAAPSVISNFHDAKHSKMQIRLMEYGDEKPTETVYHYVDATTFKVLAMDILNDALKNGAFGKFGFQEFKGSANSGREDGRPESRILNIRYDSSRSEYPYVFSILTGPGHIIGEGAIKPAFDLKSPEKKIQVSLSTLEAKKFAMQGLDYIRLWEMCHAREVFKAVEEEQQRIREERAGW